jgi:hypothetical protein
MGSGRKTQCQLHVPDLPLFRIAREATVKGNDIRSRPKPGDVSVGFLEGGVSVLYKMDAGTTPHSGKGNKNSIELETLVIVGLVVQI